MNLIWIILIIIIGSALLNPILYFIYWELYKRKEWIKSKERWAVDDRFFDSVSYWDEGPNGIKEQYTKRVQIAPVRPQVKDAYYENDLNLWVWWFPVVSSICAVCYVCVIIFSPFQKFWQWAIEKVANIKV